jgi:glycerol-3-phosphate dehydrogenase
MTRLQTARTSRSAPQHLSSYLISRSKALDAFPMPKSAELVGAVVYYDGMHNGARMNLALVLAANEHGAVATNSTEVIKLRGEPDPRHRAGHDDGCRVLSARINAIGPPTDALLALDSPSHNPLVRASGGCTLGSRAITARSMGLLDPATSDGRVVFSLPWQGRGTRSGGRRTRAYPVSRPPATPRGHALVARRGLALPLARHVGPP